MTGGRRKRLSADFPQHWLNNPPYLGLSDLEWRLFTHAAMWAIGRTDGFIPEEILPVLLPGRSWDDQQQAAKGLIEARLWIRSADVDGLPAWQWIDWKSSQSTVAEIEHARTADRGRDIRRRVGKRSRRESPREQELRAKSKDKSAPKPNAEVSDEQDFPF